MAIVQVSRITQRKGLETDLPQPLAGAEFGWAVDQRKLYIGNGTLTDGAPTVGNTEVLTEFSDILAYATAYTYQGDAAGYVVQTGSTPGTAITQSLQSRLDSYAIVTDFGATGDGATDDTDAINRALYQLYCVQSNPQVRRSLFFPAGTYVISDTILIPAYAKLYGEGADGTNIVFNVQLWAANTAFAESVLVKTISGPTTTYYRSIAQVPAAGIDITDTAYWLVTTLPDYAFQTADSQQQTGANIGVNGAVPPRNIEVSSMTFQTNESGTATTIDHNICLIEKTDQCYFDSVNFIGPLTTSDLTGAVANQSGVMFISEPATVCTQITFDKCAFGGTTYAINTDQQTAGITVSNGQFNTLYQGIILGSVTPVDGGPTGVRIMHNIFDNIYAEALVMDTCSLNASAYNTFYDVANHFAGSTNPAAPVISINANNNVSIGDMFQRTTAQTQIGSGYPRIRLYNNTTLTVPNSIGFANSDQLQIGTYIRGSGQQSTMLDGTTGTLLTINTALTVPNGGFKAFKMEYTIYRTTASTKAIRSGTLSVVAGDAGDSAGEGLVYTDDYTENEQTDIALTPIQASASNIVTVDYTSLSTGNNATIYYSITHLA